MPTSWWRPVSIASFSLVPTCALPISGLDRELQLGADAVIGRDQQGIGVASRLEIEEAAESPELRIRTRTRRRAGEGTDGLHQRIAGIDRHAGVGIGEGLLAHWRRAVETSRLDFHAVVAKRPRECFVALSSSPS